MLWYDECHEFRHVEPAWMFGIVQCEKEGMPLRFSDGKNVVVIRYVDNCFHVGGSPCARAVLDEIGRLGRWLEHEVSVSTHQACRRFEDQWVPTTNRETRRIHARRSPRAV